MKLKGVILTALAGVTLASCGSYGPVAAPWHHLSKATVAEVASNSGADINACIAFDKYQSAPTKQLATTMIIAGLAGGLPSIAKAAFALQKAAVAGSSSGIVKGNSEYLAACNSVDLGPNQSPVN